MELPNPHFDPEHTVMAMSFESVNSDGPCLCEEGSSWQDPGRLPPQNLFVEFWGPDISVTKKPHEMFLRLFPRDVIEVMAQRTRESAGEFFMKTSDLEHFLGTVIHMTAKPREDYRDYWSERPEIRDDHIAGHMTQEKFNWFLKNLRLDYGDESKALKELSIITRRLSETFSSFMKPSRDQYLSKTTITGSNGEGYAFCSRYDSTGYVCQFKICGLRDFHSDFAYDLTESLTGKWHHLYMDSAYNSVETVEALLSRGIYSCGPTENKSGLPCPLCMIGFGSRGVLINEKGVVCMNREWFQDKCYLTSIVQGPSYTLEYDTVVSEHARMSEASHVSRSVYPKSNVSWHGAFWYLLDVAMTNAYILYCKKFNSHLTLTEFRSDVASGLVEKGKKNSKPRKKMNVVKPKGASHLPVETTSRRCYHCSTKAVPRRTTWSCNTCNVALCLLQTRNCFLLFHTDEENYHSNKVLSCDVSGDS